MNYEGSSILSASGSNDPQIAANKKAIAINTEAIQENKEDIAINTDQISINQLNLATSIQEISANRQDIARNTIQISNNKADILTLQRVYAACSTNPATSGEVSQSQLLLASGPRALLEQGLGVNETIRGLISSRYTTHPDITFGLGLSGTPTDIRYRKPIQSSVPVTFKVNLQLNLIFPSQLVIYQVRVYLLVGYYAGDVNQGRSQVVLQDRFITVGPGGVTTTISFNDFIFSTPSLPNIDELRISPIIDSSYGPGPLPAYIEIVQDWTRPVGNYFKVEVL